MKIRTGLTLVLTLGLLLPAAAAAAPTPSLLAGPCAPGQTYDTACDVDHDGDVDIFDIQLSAGHWNQNGTWMSDNDHDHLGQTWTGTNQSLKIQGSYTTPYSAPLVLSNSARDGLLVDSAARDAIRVGSSGVDGLHITQAGDDGVEVVTAGAPSTTIPPLAGTYNGYEVHGAATDGLFVGRADYNGVDVESAGFAGLRVGYAGTAGLAVDVAGGAGVSIGSTGSSGISVLDSGADGLWVNTADGNGVQIAQAGSPSATIAPPANSHSGYVVRGAEYAGLFVGHASIGLVAAEVFNGVLVESAAVDGLNVQSAGDEGIDVAGTNGAGYFNGGIQVVNGGCTGCLLETFGVTAGEKALQPGDPVSLTGLRESGVDSVPMLMEVRLATGSDAVVGVVLGWAELVTEDEPRPSEIGLRLAPRDGVAEPGQYVTIAYSGLTQVKVSGPVAQGSKLAVGTDGAVRAQRTVTVDGVELAENATVIGVALEDLPAGDGLIWALVNVQ